jgi:hypothetical protein
MPAGHRVASRATPGTARPVRTLTIAVDIDRRMNMLTAMFRPHRRDAAVGRLVASRVAGTLARPSSPLA